MFGKPKKKCSTCTNYQQSPVRGQGWCRNPALRKPHERSLVSGGGLACDKKFYDFWEPAAPKGGRTTGVSLKGAVRPEALVNATADPAGGPRPPKTAGTPQTYLYATGVLALVLIVLVGLLLASEQDPEGGVSLEITPSNSTPIPLATSTALPTATTAPPSPTSTPAAPAVAATKVKVANTDGLGVFLRRTPDLADRIVAWPDGTVLDVIGPDRESGGKKWKNVRDPKGNEGWVPAEYTVAD